MNRRIENRLGALVLSLLAACATAVSQPGGPGAEAASPDLDRLREIAASRSGSADTSSYRLGPGDLVEMVVLGQKDMTRKARISQAGDIQVPLIGSVKAAGMSEAELASAIADRLTGPYFKNAQVDVFVAEYRSRQVAVTGAVAKPGLHSMTRERYTILDMLSEAGGLTRDAGGFIEFVPAETADAPVAFRRAESGALGELETGESITISLGELMRGSNRTLLKLPLVPGDVLFVPEAGSFAIEGWVEKPGTYPLTRGTTVLSALAIGGGALFPARISSIELLRSATGDGNPPEIATIDVAAIREGRSADVVLRAGDVLRVPAHALLVPPWAVYNMVRELMRFGASVAVI